jgi:Histidine kinase
MTTTMRRSRCKPPRDAWHGTRESRFRRRRLRDLPSTGDIGMSGAFRGVARWQASLLALVSGAGAWGIFAATHADLGWSLSVLVAVAYLTAIGAWQWLLVERSSVAYRRAAEERDEALRLSAERETMLPETEHRIANNLAAISAMLGIQGRRLDDGVARRAIEGAAARPWSRAASGRGYPLRTRGQCELRLLSVRPSARLISRDPPRRTGAWKPP